MAGGYWTSQNKVIPGAYINFITEGQENIVPSDRGIVTMPFVSNWGKVRDFVTVDSKTDFKSVLGYDLLDSELLLVKEALKRAKCILLYRISTGTKATVTSGGLTITAKYEGTRGNDLTVSIVADADVANAFKVTTYLAGVAVDEQIAKTISDLVANDFVVFSGTGSTALVASAGLSLTSATDTEATSSDYSTYFGKCEVQDFNVMALCINDATIKAAAATFVKRMIETEGKKIQVVTTDYATADHEGVISVENGVILSDGTTIDKVKAVAWVAGATAGAAINKDLAYTAYDDAVDVDTRYTDTQVETMLKAGKFFFVPKNFDGNIKIVVQDDINTFTTFTKDKGKEFSWNRSVRTMFDIGTTLPALWERSYIGKVNADEEGANLFKGDVIKYFDNLQTMHAIKNFDSKNDIQVTVNDDNSAYCEVAIQIVKAFKKLYMNVRLG